MNRPTTHSTLRHALVARAVALMLARASLGPAVASAAPDAPPATSEALARADAAFAEGKAAFAHKDFATAAAAFERANAIVAHGRSCYLAGLAWLSASDALRAAEAFERALQLGELRPEQEADARAKLVDLDTQLGRLEIQSDSAVRVTVDDGPDLPLPLSLRVNPGQHTIRSQLASGAPLTLSVAVAKGAVEVVKLVEPAAPEPIAPPAPQISTPATAPAKPLPPPAPRVAAASRTDARLPFFVAGGTAFGLSAISVGVMAYFGAHAVASRDEFVSGGRVDAALHDEAVRSRAGANVLIGVASALAATGVVLFLVAPADSDQKAAAKFSITPSGLTFEGRY